MKLLLVAASLVAVASATGTVHMEIFREVDYERSLDLALKARSTTSTFNVPMYNLVIQYRMNVSIGTPPQPIVLAVDTGSSDVWVPEAQACGEDSQSTCDGGFFNASSSSTFKDLGSGFDISFVDKTGSTGDYFSDRLTAGNVTLSNFIMGLALKTTVSIGLVGIGYSSNEANVANGKIKEHPTFVDALVTAGAIPSTAYSLWLNDLHAGEGSVLFGGIDTTKYSGTLAIVDIYQSTGRTTITELLVALTSVSVSSSSGTDLLTPNDYAVRVVLDSGTTLTYLPIDLATLAFNEVGAVYNSTIGFAIVACSLANKNGTFNFGFGGHDGPQVSVPMSELVSPIPLKNGQFLTDGNGKQVCRFGIAAQEPGAAHSILFGDTFLRSAYVVYDLENDKIALAQAKQNVSNSNIVPFASKGATIPSATVAPGASGVVSATATTVSTGQSLTAAKGFQSAATRGLLVPLSVLELVMFALGVAFFSLGGVSVCL